MDDLYQNPRLLSKLFVGGFRGESPSVDRLLILIASYALMGTHETVCDFSDPGTNVNFSVN